MTDVPQIASICSLSGKIGLRKGGPFALDIAAELRRAGIENVCLHVVGCRPEIPIELSNIVQVHGFLRTGNPAERNRLESLFIESHFLVVPTMAECFGLVFAEAESFGLPPVLRAIQAIPEIVLDGQSGMLGAADASAGSYARRIADLFRNPIRYREMARLARQRYENRFNWNSFAEGFVNLVQSYES